MPNLEFLGSLVAENKMIIRTDRQIGRLIDLIITLLISNIYIY